MLPIPLSHTLNPRNPSPESRGGGGGAMENGGGAMKTTTEWRFGVSDDLLSSSRVSIRGVLTKVMENLPGEGVAAAEPIPLGHGDPSVFPCFRTTTDAEDAIVSAVRSAKFNCYGPTVGLLPARRAIAEYLSHDLPCEPSPDDVYLTSGCTQAIELVLSVLARPGANILLPRPGFPFYEARTAFSGLEARHFDLLPHKVWEIDLDAVEALTDENTVAIVLINPGNPCGNVFSKQHLAKASSLNMVAETAKKLGILVIADEVYGQLAFGETPFVPMGAFGSIVPIITVGSISKRWVVPGWRLGWIVMSDPNGILKQTKIIEGIKGILNITSDPATFIQVELNLSLLKGIEDDVDFCCKLAREESVVILPGSAVGLKNWLRITFAVDPSSLEDGLGRLKSFCKRHSKAE
ncbi:S-alkyl-thiohydroximate lyase SUR1 [Acorus gramineus]|uniref:S-alkyl-thiohydroximate lyase SUR1 n=1 Tax=Acorus gramineus TaxID=55184 RepID=A0AAV9AVS6_ACOGR|nr:S-alkyl-thiohydroximate lyase SUR1 [Acorus gramineus]